MKKFTNPLSPFDAPDPCIVFDEVTGYYYCSFTQGNRVELYRSKNLATLFSDNDTKVIFRASEELKVKGCIWAPEIHKAPNGKWYIYTSGYEGEDGTTPKRLIVLECQSEDLFGEWEYKGKPLPSAWAIDPTVLTLPSGEQYACFSFIEHKNGTHNLLGICKMINPYTFDQNVSVISRAELSWELVPPHHDTRTLNEGPYFIQTDKDIFLVYSANGCWSDHYCLGMLRYKGGDICDKDSWEKLPKPLLSYGNEVYGPGHATFMLSPDKTELWCVYHGMKESNQKCEYAPRFLNVQKVDFDDNGVPVMNEPIGYKTEINPPSGE